MLTAGYLINRTPSLVLNGKTPYSVLYGKEPVRPEKFQFLEKGQNHNFGQKSKIYSLDLG